MTKKRALVFLKTDPPVTEEEEWSNWYSTKHIQDRLPDSLGIPGYIRARRYIRIEGKPAGYVVEPEVKYLTLYDLISTDVLKSEAYAKLRKREESSDRFAQITVSLPTIARGVYEQIYPEEGEYEPPACRFVLVVGHDVPQNRQQEFNVWYNTEHIPAMMLRVPGFLTARRFKLARGEFLPLPGSKVSVPQFLTIYDIEDENIFESDAFVQESVSPWSTWVRSWSTRRLCMLCRRIYPRD